jgi:hypothetical protein
MKRCGIKDTSDSRRRDNHVAPLFVDHGRGVGRFAPRETGRVLLTWCPPLRESPQDITATSTS